MKSGIIIAITILVTFVLLYFIFVNLTKKQKVEETFIETYGVISKVGISHPRKSTQKRVSIVTYIGTDGLEHEGRLDASIDLPMGRKVKIKYSPTDYENVFFMYEEL